LYKEPPEICLERARIYTESWRETESEPVAVRRALALARVLHEMTVFIDDGELIVGNHASRPLAVPLFPEFSAEWLEEEMDCFAARAQDAFTLRDEDRPGISELVGYWRGKTHFDRVLGNIERSLPEEVAEVFDRDGLNVNQVYHTVVNTIDGDGHVALDFAQILSLGFEGLAQKARMVRDGLDLSNAENVKKRIFLQSVIIACDAAAEFGRRYASLARRSADSCDNEARRDELLAIAEVCDRVPAAPAETFRGALQSVWFAFLLSQIESNGHSMSLGRLDQYLYPYYAKDLERGRISREEACELLECFWIKTAELNKLRNWRSTRFKTGYPMFQTVTLGGQTREGLDAVNELSYLCLEVTAELKLVAPTVVARIHPESPEPFLYACCKTNLQHGGGLPGLFNDSVAIPTLLNLGIPLDDARDWAVVGCAGIFQPAEATRNRSQRGSESRDRYLSLSGPGRSVHLSILPRGGERLSEAIGMVCQADTDVCQRHMPRLRGGHTHTSAISHADESHRSRVGRFRWSRSQLQ